MVANTSTAVNTTVPLESTSTIRPVDCVTSTTGTAETLFNLTMVTSTAAPAFSTIQTFFTSTMETSTAAPGSRSIPESVKDLFLSLIEKPELHFLGWAVLGLILVILIGCCIGCKGCCCRACCGARETRFSAHLSRLPDFISQIGRQQQKPGQEAGGGRSTRCCNHPGHCDIDNEQPFACDCRQACTRCTANFPTQRNYNMGNGMLIEESTERTVFPGRYIAEGSSRVLTSPHILPREYYYPALHNQNQPTNVKTTAQSAQPARRNLNPPPAVPVTGRNGNQSQAQPRVVTNQVQSGTQSQGQPRVVTNQVQSGTQSQGQAPVTVLTPAAAAGNNSTGYKWPITTNPAPQSSVQQNTNSNIPPQPNDWEDE